MGREAVTAQAVTASAFFGTAYENKHQRDYEVAVLITNDSDLLEAVRIVRQELNLPVGILNPYNRPSHVLLRHASFIKPIRKGVLAASQFPRTLTDNNGIFYKPVSW